MRIVVYTAIAGGYDVLRHTGRLGEEHRFVAFTDEAPGTRLGWQVRPVCQQHDSPRLNAKRHQVMPHLDFPDVEYSLYHDGTHTLQERIDPERLVEVYLQNTDLATFRHNHGRDCAYDEAEVCVAKLLDDPDRIRDQMARYRAAGFPEHAGLPGITLLLRRHTERVATFNEAWWAEIRRGSSRDQLSFPYVAWKLGIKWTPIPGDCYYNPFTHFVPHGWLWSEGGVPPGVRDASAVAG